MKCLQNTEAKNADHLPPTILRIEAANADFEAIAA
jgi:hypothetical protein